MLVLGIDTSCDDTSVAIFESESGKLLSDRVSSDIELHAQFGGVVPEIAARQHLEIIIPMISNAFDEAGIAPDPDTIDLIAATRGPGLIGGLLVGLGCAKALSLGWNVPFVGVNHLEGHLISAALSQDIPYPHIAMVVSGGHSEIYRANSPADYILLGETRDDAAGELLDKVGRLLDIPFPAGPTIDRWALDPENGKSPVRFPRPLLNKTDNIEFSFSGLKTACLYFLRSDESANVRREIIGAEVFRAAVDCLLGKAFLASDRENLSTIIISGGVAASSYLKREAEKRASDENKKVIFPEKRHCTDNAAMIALAGLYKFEKYGPDTFDLDCDSSITVGN
ncbi:MAG: tRNA (adenosine(37)-N6)-threonylcarbamoyltransferase complex transferase subunit TsaD [bacterium]|nr:tRNA (adenosine(37)-N6)-threonylcarbamoyltransferase complex transferase subunit TsaD [bacterium]